MSFTDNFNRCDIPICSPEINVLIRNYYCTGSSLFIEWEVVGTNNNYSFLEENKLLWSNNDTSFENSENSLSSSSPYNVNISILSLTGIIYFKARIRISTSFYESEIITFNINDCVITDEKMVRASLCSTCEPPQSEPDYNLYVKKGGISYFPCVFRYDNLCWNISEDSYNSDIVVDEKLGIILDSIFTESDIIYGTEGDCCVDIRCPSSDWEISGSDRVAEFYIEYSTYTIRNRIIIYSNFNEENCTGTEIWNSGEVGTCRNTDNSGADCSNYTCDGDIGNNSKYGEGKGKYTLSNLSSDWSYNYNCVKKDCFQVYESQLPIGISVIPGEVGANWCFSIFGPNFQYTSCGENDSECVKSNIVI